MEQREQGYDVVVLGAGPVGQNAADRARAAGLRVAAGQVPITRLWHAVLCFPTISELWLRLLEAYRDPAQDFPGR